MRLYFILISIIFAFGLVLGALAFNHLVMIDRYPDLERDAQRLGVYLTASKPCGLPRPAGAVDSIHGKYDFHAPASEAFEQALTAVMSEEAAKLAELSGAEMSDYCQRAKKDLPWFDATGE